MPMKLMGVIFCAVLSFGVGCSSTCYKISPTPAANASWNNKALSPGEIRVHYVRQGGWSGLPCVSYLSPLDPNVQLARNNVQLRVFNARNGMYEVVSDPISWLVQERIRQEYLKSGQLITDKKADIDIYISVNGPHGLWTVIPYMCSMGFLPTVMSVNETVWGDVKVLDAHGRIIHKHDIPRYSAESSTYLSFLSPLGLLGRVIGGKDIQEAGILCFERGSVHKKINTTQQSFLSRILLPEINKITLTASEQPSLAPGTPTVDTPKIVPPNHPESETGKKLKELKRLLDQGLIRQEEYQKKRAQVLDRM